MGSRCDCEHATREHRANSISRSVVRPSGSGNAREENNHYVTTKQTAQTARASDLQQKPLDETHLSADDISKRRYDTDLNPNPACPRLLCNQHAGKAKSGDDREFEQLTKVHRYFP